MTAPTLSGGGDDALLRSFGDEAIGINGITQSRSV